MTKLDEIARLRRINIDETLALLSAEAVVNIFCQPFIFILKLSNNRRQLHVRQLLKIVMLLIQTQLMLFLEQWYVCFCFQK